MRLCSFDVFDTVLTRDVADPKDLFLFCGRALVAQGWNIGTPSRFAEERLAAESRARATAIHADATLDEIYIELARTFLWDFSQREKVKQVELEEEAKSLTSFPEARDRVRIARENGWQVAYLSDMYLPPSFIEGILRRERLFQETDHLYVSSDHRAAKATGALFEKVRRDFDPITQWRHFGDNFRSDYQVPRRQGIESRHVSDALLTGTEKLVRGHSQIASPARSALAGAMRLARLREPRFDGTARDMARLAGEIAAPLLFAHVAWVLAKARQREVDRLYFVSRDGEILLKIARILCRSWKIDLDCRYLYGSRQAWHAPAITSFGEHEKAWLLSEDVPLTGNVIAARLGIPPNSALRREFDMELSLEAPETPLNRAQVSAVWKILQSSHLSQKLTQFCAERRSAVIGYLDQEEFFDSAKIGLVDIGWRGTLQRSLCKLLDAEGRSRPLEGFYFGFVASPPDSGSFHSFWSDFMGSLFPYKYTILAEIVTAGCEGSLIGYEFREGRYVPVLNRSRNTEALNWGLPELQAHICAFADEVSQRLTFGDMEEADLGWALGSLFLALCQTPNREDARVLGSFLHATDQTECNFEPVVDFDLPPRLFARYAWNKTLWHDHPWIEGQLAYSPCWPVQVAHSLRRAKRKISSLLKNRTSPSSLRLDA